MLTFEEPGGYTPVSSVDYHQYQVSNYLSGLTTTQEYGVGVWLKKNSWAPSNFEAIMRISLSE